MVLWAVLTPLVIFLVLVPGYVVATYVKHRREFAKEKPGSRLLGNERVSTYYTSRQIVKEKLQERSSLNVPTAVKHTTKHLRSVSTVVGSPHIPATKALVLQQPPTKREHLRRNSSPVSVVLTPHHHHPNIVETYSPYQVQSAPPSCDERSPDEGPIKMESIKRKSDRNNNGKARRPRHLIPHSPNHFYATTGTSPFIIPMKMEPLRETLKVDMPEIMDKP